MTTAIHETGRWIYQGVWANVIRWLRLPAHPPMLPTLPGETAQVFQPSPGWLRYLKFQFWASVIAATVPIVMIEIALLVYYPLTGILAAFPFLAIDAFFAAIGYLTLHLKYDTTWYVMTSRSLRIRRGVWTVHETTITFENVQNIRIDQGPLERYFGVGNLLVETAGGGGGLSAEHAQAMQQGQFHRGLIEGIDNAPAIRELILPRIRHTDGLGGETEPREPAREPTRWRSEHLAVLRDIRDHSQRLAHGAPASLT